MIGNNKKELYKEAFYEVDKIINIMPYSLSEKIPDNFKNFIKKNKSQNYEFQIDKKNLLNEKNLKKETCIILSLIYRSYLCTKEEQEKLNQKDIVIFNKEQKELEEKYSYEKMFPKQNTKVEKNSELVLLKENYFRKVLNHIKDFFKLIKK